MKRETLIARWKRRLEQNVAESRRQSQFAGERLGVFARLRELGRERRRIAKRLIEIDQEHEQDYAFHAAN